MPNLSKREIDTSLGMAEVGNYREMARVVRAMIAGQTPVRVASPVAVTATTGTLPATTGSVTIANAASPTNAELLKLLMEINAKLTAS